MIIWMSRILIQVHLCHLILRCLLLLFLLHYLYYEGVQPFIPYLYLSKFTLGGLSFIFLRSYLLCPLM
ncbi:hypothetical protein BGX38DRAFT_1207486, partial [Terfezia claveryi]